MDFKCIIDTALNITIIGVDDAKDIGIDISELYFDETMVAPTILDTIQIGTITATHLEADVTRLESRLCIIGVNFLRSLSSFEIKDDVLILEATRVI